MHEYLETLIQAFARRTARVPRQRRIRGRRSTFVPPVIETAPEPPRPLVTATQNLRTKLAS